MPGLVNNVVGVSFSLNTQSLFRSAGGRTFYSGGSLFLSSLNRSLCRGAHLLQSVLGSLLPGDRDLVLRRLLRVHNSGSWYSLIALPQSGKPTMFRRTCYAGCVVPDGVTLSFDACSNIIDLRAGFYHAIQGLHVIVIKRKLMMNDDGQQNPLSDKTVLSSHLGNGSTISLRVEPVPSSSHARRSATPTIHYLQHSTQNRCPAPHFPCQPPPRQTSRPTPSRCPRTTSDSCDTTSATRRMTRL